MSNAPVCNINVQPPTSEPTQPQLPAIPVATDLASALNAINTMRRIIQTITNQNSNNAGFRTTSFKTNQSGQKKNSNFQEVAIRRTTKTTKIYQNNDPSTGVYVEVKQITGLTFVNKATGQEVVWSQ